MRASLSTVTVRAPAKVNLHLCVGRSRPDGFHDLTTVFQAVSLYDEVTVTRADALSVVVRGATADGVPVDDTNLAVRAVRLVADEAGVDPHVSVVLDKGIPVAGGCAGGSADAAAALVACDALWQLGLGKDDLAALGARLGSDVPFALHGGTALGTGRGERLTPVLGAGSYHWVLALSEGGLATPDVYGELDRRRAASPVVGNEPTAVVAALRKGSAADLGRALSNDLQAAALALRPQLRGLLDSGLALGALGAVVSGSGPTVAFLAEDAGHAGALATALGLAELSRAVVVAQGPVHGARVVGSA